MEDLLAVKDQRQDELENEQKGELRVSEAQLENVRRIFHRQAQNPEEDQSNEGAAGLIHSLGYSWINSVMRLSGFPGVWLAGDYTGSTVWPSAQIAAANNEGYGAQVTTARDLAALMAVIARKDLRESMQMRSWLALGAGTEWDPPEGEQRLPKGFKFLGAKVGLTPDSIYSEAAIVERTAPAPARKLVFVWQNSSSEQVDTVLSVIRRTLEIYLPEPTPRP